MAPVARVAASVVTGDHRRGERQTVGDYAARWIETKDADGLHPVMVSMHRLYLNRDLIPRTGPHPAG
jgi:hypothetical protein